MPTREELDPVVAEAAMRIAAVRGWRYADPLTVAENVDIPLEVFFLNWPARRDLLAAVTRVVDARVLAGGRCDGRDPVRDRILDILLRRFEALQPYRQGLQVVVRDLPRDPVTATAFALGLGQSMQWMLRLAGVEAEGVTRGWRIGGLAALYLATFRTWLEDDSPDLSKTMAALDRLISRVEAVMTRLNLSPEPDTTGADQRPVS